VKKFRQGWQLYIFSGSFLAIVIISSLTDKGTLSTIIYTLCVICACITLIGSFFTYDEVNEEGLLQKYLFFRSEIYWDSIDKVMLNQKFLLFKYSISIYGNGKKINLTNWTKDSKELIKIIVDECKKRDIKVELMVEKIIED
jgi:hypothetical protein